MSLPSLKREYGYKEKTGFEGKGRRYHPYHHHNQHQRPESDTETGGPTSTNSSRLARLARPKNRREKVTPNPPTPLLANQEQQPPSTLPQRVLVAPPYGISQRVKTKYLRDDTKVSSFVKKMLSSRTIERNGPTPLRDIPPIAVTRR